MATSFALIDLKAAGLWWHDSPPLDYDMYLRSSLWKSIRSRVKKATGRRCVGCGEAATAVHHRSYAPAVLDGDDDSQLVPLCNDCHHEVHFEANGTKRTDMAEIDRVLHALVFEFWMAPWA